MILVTIRKIWLSIGLMHLKISGPEMEKSIWPVGQRMVPVVAWQLQMFLMWSTFCPETIAIFKLGVKILLILSNFVQILTSEKSRSCWSWWALWSKEDQVFQGASRVEKELLCKECSGRSKLSSSRVRCTVRSAGQESTRPEFQSNFRCRSKCLWTLLSRS